MIVRISTMGPLRRIAQIDDEELHVPDGATVGDAVESLMATHPGLAPHRASLMVALDEEWVDAGCPLRSECSLVLMPPVSGG